MEKGGITSRKVDPERPGDDSVAAEVASDEIGWYYAQDANEDDAAEEAEEEENGEGEQVDNADDRAALASEAVNEEEETRQEQQQATEELESAMAVRDGKLLAAALQRARGAGLGIALLEQAQSRLSALEEDAKRAQARRVTARALENAINGSDIKVLRSAIDWAHKTGVDTCMVERAHRRLSELRSALRQARRSEVEREALARAIGSNDVEALTSAIDSAIECGVIGPIIENARKRRLVLQQQARKRQKTERHEAAEALEIMSVGADLEALASCIEWASTTGVDEQLIALAKKRMAGLQQEESRQHTIDQVTTKVNDAIEHSGVETLDDVIEEALKKGVKHELVQRARKRREELSEVAKKEEVCKAATEKLQLLLPDSDIVAITAAAEEAAQAGVDADLLLKACKRKRFLEFKERLKQAVHSADADKLASLVDHGLQIGLRPDQDETIRLAQAKLRALEKERKEGELVQAEGKMAMAMEGSNIEELAQAYSHAVEWGVSEELLQLARHRVTELENEERRCAQVATSEQLDNLREDVR